MSPTCLTVTSCGSGVFTVTVNGLALNNILIGVNDPGEVVAGLQDVTCRQIRSEVKVRTSQSVTK